MTIACTAFAAAFLLSRKSIIANIVGIGFALDAAGMVLTLAGTALDAVLDSL